MDLAGSSSSRISFVSGNITDRSVVSEALDGMDAVVHLAAVPKYFPDRHDDFIKINYTGLFNILEESIRYKVKKLVFASSICAYGFIYWKMKTTPQVELKLPRNDRALSNTTE